MGGAIVAGALTGSLWSRTVSGRHLELLFAVVALAAGVLMLLPPRRGDSADLDPARVPFSRTGTVMAGLAVACSAASWARAVGMVVPTMIYLLGIPTRIAMGTSMVVAGLSAGAGLIGKLLTGQVPLLQAGLVSAGALVGAQLGGHLSQRVREKSLRRILAVIILFSGLRLAWGT